MSFGNKGIALQESSELRKNITKYFSHIQQAANKQKNDVLSFNTKTLSENLLYFEATAQMIEYWLQQLVTEKNEHENLAEFKTTEEHT